MNEVLRTRGRMLLQLSLLVAVSCASGFKEPFPHRPLPMLDRAIRTGEQQVAAKPNDGDTHYFLGGAYLMKAWYLDSATGGYSDSSRACLAQARSEWKRTKELTDLWNGAIQTETERAFMRHYERGVIAGKQGNQFAKSQQFELAITVFSGESWRDTTTATQEIDRSIREWTAPGKGNWKVLFALHSVWGDLLYSRGDVQEAAAQFKMAVELARNAQ